MNLTLENSTTERVSPVLETIAQNIVSRAKCCDSVQKDLLFVLVLVLMLENGFVPVKQNGEPVNDIRYIDAKRLSKWKLSSGMLQARFVHSGFQDVPLTLIISPLGPTAIVNVIINSLDCETYTVCIPVSRYVVSPQASTIPMIFRDLKHISNLFKNNISSPVKSRVLGLYGYPSASLIGVPENVFYRIAVFLPVPDIVRLSQTCKRVKFLVGSQCLWRNLYRRDFKDEEPVEQTEIVDWETLYKEKHIANLEERLRRSTRFGGTLHDMEYSDFFSRNPAWDSMII